MATKMKGLLKGLRYISQIFDDEKEPEMQIGFPTDVKHVAHIGWDGSAVNSPSWMDSFKPEKDSMSGPLGADDSSLRGSLHGSSPARDLPDLPKPSRRCSAEGDIFSMDSTKKEKSEKTSSRHSRNRHSGSGSKEIISDNGSSRSSSRNQLLPDLVSGSESPSHNLLPDIPKKSRRKKSKDSSQGGSSKSSSRTAKAIAEASTYTSPFSDPGLGSRTIDLYSCPSPNSQPFDQARDKKLHGFS